VKGCLQVGGVGEEVQAQAFAMQLGLLLSLAGRQTDVQTGQVWALLGP